MRPAKGRRVDITEVKRKPEGVQRLVVGNVQDAVGEAVTIKNEPMD